MKFRLRAPPDILDDEIQSFSPYPIDEIQYNRYKQLSVNNFINTKKWLLYLDKKKTKNETLFSIIPISTHVKIISCQHDIITQRRTYRIETYAGNQTIIQDFDSSVLTLPGISQLLRYGCIYDETKVRLLQQYLANSAHHAQIEDVYSRFGWLFGQEITFLSGEAVAPQGSKSYYTGSLDIKPSGSPDRWLQMVKSEVIGNIPLTFILLLGFSSMILGYLNHFMDIGCLVFNLVNSSSKGKTTGAMLAASIWGNPSFDKGFITTFNSTMNALVEFVSQANSHTVVLDEAATGDRSSFRKILYQLCSGRDRMRLNTEGSMKETHVFNSIILTTAEFPVVDETAPNGIRARVFEVRDTLTQDAENADHIKSCVYQNYGHAGVEFSRFVISQKLGAVLTDYEKAVKVLKKRHNDTGCTPGELTNRVISKLAVILLTASYVDECFHFNMDDALIDYLLSLEQSISTGADLSDKALDCIRQYVSRNNNRFLIDKNSDFICSRLEGKIEAVGTSRKITILKEVVEQILTNNGFENPKNIYQMWQAKKILVSEKDRPYKRVRLDKTLPVQPCFIFIMEE